MGLWHKAKHTKKYAKKREEKEKFAKTGSGEYRKQKGYSFVRPAKDIVRNGKTIHLKKKRIHVKEHLVHKRKR